MKTESVWDYPLPPKVEPATKRVCVEFAGKLVATTRQAMRVLETSHPPVYYIPRGDVSSEFLVPGEGETFCEFKGWASYWTLRVDDRHSANAALSYEHPSPGYEAIQGYLAFYANKVDACFVDDEQVQAQAGRFYGGWVTSEIAGPLKGAPGTEGW